MSFNCLFSACVVTYDVQQNTLAFGGTLVDDVLTKEQCEMVRTTTSIVARVCLK